MELIQTTYRQRHERYCLRIHSRGRTVNSVDANNISRNRTRVELEWYGMVHATYSTTIVHNNSLRLERFN